MNSIVKYFKSLIVSFPVLFVITIVMPIVFAPTAGASDSSWVSLDEKLDLALKSFNLDEESVDEIISGKRTKGESEILVICKKKKPAKKKEKKSKADKKKGRNPQTGEPIKIKSKNVVKFKKGK